MNCKVFIEQLDTFLSAELAGPERDAFLAHAAHCRACRGELEAARELQAGLRELPVAPPTPDFAERVLRRARQAHEAPTRPRGFLAGFGTALAAGLALWAVVGLFPVSQQQVGTPAGSVPEVTIALDQTSQVNLVFQAAREVADAKIAIELPENIMLAGYPDRRRLEWRTHLNKGSNLLRLPLVAIGDGQDQQLVARIEYGDAKTTTLKVRLKVAKPNLSGQWPLDQRHNPRLRT